MPVYNPSEHNRDLEEQEVFHAQAQKDLEECEQHCNGLCDRDGHPIPDHREDIVNKPIHYTVGGYEAIDTIRAKMTPEEYRGYCKGNIMKYLMRANYKGHHDQDCRKAEYYMSELIKHGLQE